MHQSFSPKILLSPLSEAGGPAFVKPCAGRLDVFRWMGDGSTLNRYEEDKQIKHALNRWLDENPLEKVGGIQLRYDFGASQFGNYSTPRAIITVHALPYGPDEDPVPNSQRGFEFLRWIGDASGMTPKEEMTAAKNMVNEWIENNPDKVITKVTGQFNRGAFERDFTSSRVLITLHWVTREFAPNPYAVQDFDLMLVDINNHTASGGFLSGEQEDEHAILYFNDSVKKHPDSTTRGFFLKYSWDAHPYSRDPDTIFPENHHRFSRPQYFAGIVWERLPFQAPKPASGLEIIRFIGESAIKDYEEDKAIANKVRTWMKDNPDKIVKSVTLQYDYAVFYERWMGCRYIIGLAWEQAPSGRAPDADTRDVDVFRFFGPTGSASLSRYDEDTFITQRLDTWRDENPGRKIDHAKIQYDWVARGQDLEAGNGVEAEDSPGAHQKLESSGPRIISIILHSNREK